MASNRIDDKCYQLAEKILDQVCKHFDNAEVLDVPVKANELDQLGRAIERVQNITQTIISKPTHESVPRVNIYIPSNGRDDIEVNSDDNVRDKIQVNSNGYEVNLHEQEI